MILGRVDRPRSKFFPVGFVWVTEAIVASRDSGERRRECRAASEA
jgi:hypothetical protein